MRERPHCWRGSTGTLAETRSRLYPGVAVKMAHSLDGGAASLGSKARPSQACARRQRSVVASEQCVASLSRSTRVSSPWNCAGPQLAFASTAPLWTVPMKAVHHEGTLTRPCQLRSCPTSSNRTGFASRLGVLGRSTRHHRETWSSYGVTLVVELLVALPVTLCGAAKVAS